MGTQTAIVDTIIKGKADYCLAVKGNQETLYDDIALYFSDVNLLEELQENAQYYQTVEKSRDRLKLENTGCLPISNGCVKTIPNGISYVVLG